MKTEDLLKIILVALVIVITAIAIMVMPGMADQMARTYAEFANLKIPGLVLIYASLIPLYIAIFETWKLLKMAEDKEVFNESSAKSLDRIKYSTGLIFIMYSIAIITLLILRVPFSAAYLTLIIAGLAMLAISLFASVLKKLLLIAINYKTENELTI